MSGQTENEWVRLLLPLVSLYLFTPANAMHLELIHAGPKAFIPCLRQTCYDLLSDTPGTADNLVIVDDHGITQVRGPLSSTLSGQPDRDTISC